MRAVEKIKLNLVPGGSPGGILPRVRVSQGDAQDRILQFEVYDGNEAASLSGIVSCYIGGTKPDGNGFTVDCTKNTNIVTAVLTDQATVLPGNIRCKLYLLSSTGSVRSASFELDVDPDPLADAGTSDTDITAIVQAAAMYAREAGEAAATAVSSAWDAMGASWEENHEYTVDDMVVFGQDDGGQGHIYKCILTHTSSDAILPTDTTYWEDTTLCAQISSLNSNYAKLSMCENIFNSISSSTGTWKNLSLNGNYKLSDYELLIFNWFYYSNVLETIIEPTKTFKQVHNSSSARVILNSGGVNLEVYYVNDTTVCVKITSDPSNYSLRIYGCLKQ